MPLYVSVDDGKIYLEVTRFNYEFLYLVSLPTGVGSNPLGLDRGQLGTTKVVTFERAGNKVPNYKETQNYVATVGELYAALKPVPVAQAKATNGRVKVTYGEGYVMAGARDPYILKAPGAAQGVALGGAAGRGNMVAPLQRLPAPDTPIAVD